MSFSFVVVFIYRNLVEQPEIIQATPFDVMFLLLPELIKVQEKGKIGLGDLELNKNLRSIVDALKSDDVDKFCETSELNSQVYVKLSTEKLHEELTKRHARLLETMEKESIMQDYSAGKESFKGEISFTVFSDTKKYHAAKAICDCLNKKCETEFIKHLGLADMITEDAPPPPKKSKV